MNFDFIHRICDFLPGNLYVKGLKGEYLFVNDFYKSDLVSHGYIQKNETVIGLTDHDLFTKQTADIFRENDLSVIETQKIEVREEIVIAEDTPLIRKFISKKKPLHSDDHSIIGVIGYSFEASSIHTGYGDISLSSREVDCLSLLYFGYTAKQMADLLFLSARTIETHVRRLKSKLHCNNRSELNLLVERNNMTDIVRFYHSKIRIDK